MFRRPLLLVALLFAAAAASARPLDLPRPDEKWLTLRVDEFTFVSNVSPSETTAIAREVVRMRHAIGEITNLKVRSAKPTRIFIFAGERGFAPYREAVTQRKEESIQGIFLTTSGGNFIVMKRDADDGMDRTVYHELTHYFVRNTAASLPLWVSEGLAEYYSTFSTSGDAVLIGRPVAEHVHWLRGETLIPLRELFATTVDSPIYDEGQRTGVFYAQSWALVHYLMVDAGRRAKFGEFLRLLGQAKPAEEAFGSAFGKTYAEVEVDLRAYVRKKAFVYTKYLLAAASLPELPKPAPATRDALLFEFGHLLTHGTPQLAGEARRFLDEALALNAANAGAHADIGRLHHVAGRRAEANAAFQRAVELGSSDAQVYLLVGVSALDEIEGTRKIGPPTEAILKARKAFERSVELDATSALGWTGIGSTYIFTNEDPAPGIAALEKGLGFAPGDLNASFQLVQLYARAGRIAEAQQLLDTVLSRGAKKEMLDFAREAVRVASTNASIRQINEAIAKANDGKTEEAVEILDRVLLQLDDPEMLARTKELRANFASRIRK